MKRVADALGLQPETLEAMVRQAIESWPDECCGMVTTSGDALGEDLRLHECANAYNQMKEQDPEAYPRDARTAFVIDPLQQIEIDKLCRKEKREYYLFYHSHANHDAYFSDEDRAAATFPFGEPSFPEVYHLVISIYDRKLKEFFWCRWDEATGDFKGEKVVCRTTETHST